MGYAIAGLYVVLAAVLAQLFALTSRVAKLEERFIRIEEKIDTLLGAKVEKKELGEVKRRLEVVEKKLIGTTASI